MNTIDWENQIALDNIKSLFVPFNWVYEKIFYDIQLPDWTIIEKCWPNAWTIWPRTGKQYWPWECMIRISKFFPGEANLYKLPEEQRVWTETLRFKVIWNIDSILNNFWEENWFEYIKKIMHQIKNIWELEELSNIVKESNPKVLQLFFVGLLEWTELWFWVWQFKEFSVLLNKGDPQEMRNILNKPVFISTKLKWKDRLIAEKHKIYLELVEYQKKLIEDNLK